MGDGRATRVGATVLACAAPLVTRARDGQALAHILRTDGERIRPLAPESELASEFRLTIRAYPDLVAERVRFTNQLHSCLGDYYPAALGLFSELDAPISLAFLAAFSTPEAARAAGRDGIVAWLKGQGYAKARAARPAQGGVSGAMIARAIQRRGGERDAPRRHQGRRPGANPQ
jgi:hypothetical protein